MKCNSWEKACKRKRRCILSTDWCDGQNDCGDNEDEEHCGKRFSGDSFLYFSQRRFDNWQH